MEFQASQSLSTPRLMCHLGPKLAPNISTRWLRTSWTLFMFLASWALTGVLTGELILIHGTHPSPRPVVLGPQTSMPLLRLTSFICILNSPLNGFILFIVCVLGGGYRGVECHSPHTVAQRATNDKWSSLSFHHVWPRDEHQVVQLSGKCLSSWNHPGSLRLASHKWVAIPNSFLSDHTWPPQVLSSRCGPSCLSRIVSCKTAGRKEKKLLKGEREEEEGERESRGIR